MKLIDTHAHLQFPPYDEDRGSLFDQCTGEEVGMILVGCDYPSSKAAVSLAEEYGRNNIWSAVGQHPTDSDLPFIRSDFEELIKQSARVVGIGECGLDYYHLSQDPEILAKKERQKSLFREHLALADSTSLPLIIHCRDAHDDMAQILSEQSGKVHERGVMHCFTGTFRDAQNYLDVGFLISFAGIITFAKQYDEVVRAVPLEKILIETDSPFLTPVPYRGKRNSPSYVKYVAERIAEIKGVSFDEVAKQTLENAQRLFRLSLTA